MSSSSEPSRAVTTIRLHYSGEYFLHYPEVRRLWNIDRLPTVRAMLIGPRWQRSFGVEQRPLEEVRPPWMHECSARRRYVLVFTLEEDVREMITRGGAGAREEIRPGVFAEWD